MFKSPKKVIRENPPQQTLVPWTETTESERAFLLRVETQVLECHDQIQENAPNQSLSKIKRNRTQRIVWPAFVTAMGIFCFMIGIWWVKPLELPTLRAEGSLTLNPQRHAKSGVQHMQTTLLEGAKIHDSQGWSLRSHAKTQLHIIRRSPRVSLIRLQKGAITVQVKPGSMKQFVVACRNRLQVVVKGTKFLVWQNQNRVRVEVFRGHVMLRREGRSLLHLYKGQGVRIQGTRGDILDTYQIPKKANDWLSKIECLAKHQISHLFSYAWDLGEGKLLTQQRRLEVLETAAHALLGAKHWAQASRLWWRIYTLHSKGYGAQTALFQAAQSCRHSRVKRESCVLLFQRFLRNFPQAVRSLRETSLFCLGTLQLKQTPSHRHKAEQVLRRYLVLYPKGVHVSKVRRLLGISLSKPK